MDKNSKKSRFLNWLNRISETANFVDVYHLNSTSLSKPPLNYEAKYSSRPDKNDFE